MMTQFIPVLVHSLKTYLVKKKRKGTDTREFIVYYIITKKQNDNVS